MLPMPRPHHLERFWTVEPLCTFSRLSMLLTRVAFANYSHSLARRHILTGQALVTFTLAQAPLV